MGKVNSFFSDMRFEFIQTKISKFSIFLKLKLHYIQYVWCRYHGKFQKHRFGEADRTALAEKQMQILMYE